MHMNFDGPAEATLIATNLSGLGAATVQPFLSRYIYAEHRDNVSHRPLILSFTPAPT